LLEDENLNQHQIAKRLGVSERTIKWDVAKIRPYQERKFRHQLKLLQKDPDEKFEAELADKSPLEQLKILSQKMAEHNKVLKMREYYHHQIYVSIDLDKAVNGYPEIRIWPQKANATYRMPLTVNIRYVKNKKAIPFRSMTLSQNVDSGRVSL
jgi:transcriptional antiterminator